MLKDRFFDRNQHLETLQKRVLALKEGYRQNIAIVGDESVGKSSIILHFLNRFHDPNIVTVYLEARPEPQESFAKRFIGVLLYNFLSYSGINLQENLDFLISKSQRFAPETTAKVKEILLSLAKRKQNNVFYELLSLCDILNRETGKFCVVIFDEFHNLEAVGFKNLYREWEKLLVSKKNTLYIIISSMKYRTRLILSKHLSLLFGNFEVVAVEPFNIPASERYLQLSLSGIKLDGPLRNFLVHFTGGYPVYLELISEAIRKSGGADIVRILENLLFNTSGVLNQRFSNYIKRFLDIPCSNDYISILHLIASGTNKIKDIGHMLRKPSKELSLRVNRLLELDAITRSADFLKITDRVFGFWLNFVYREKQRSLSFDDKNQEAFFREGIKKMIDEFFADSDKPVLDRAIELLRLFENEQIQMERKKIRLSHFREIKPLEFANRGLKCGLIGRSQESVWIMAFKHGRLSEEDITLFAKECKRYRHKLQRNIIVTLGEIDSNTKLKAMEEKIWTWDINNLNQILDLYSKPWVIA